MQGGGSKEQGWGCSSDSRWFSINADQPAGGTTMRSLVSFFTLTIVLLIPCFAIAQAPGDIL